MADVKERHKVPGEYMYDGIVFPEDFPKHILDRIKYKFQLRDDDVLVATYPKTGTTWIQEIVWLIMNNVDTASANATILDERMLFLEVDKTNNEGLLHIDAIDKLTSPRIIKTHLPFHFFAKQLKTKKTKVILGARNVKDTLVSFYHFYRMNATFGRMTGSFSDFFDLFKEKHLSYGDWFDYYLDYWNNRDDLNMLLVKYEDLHKSFKGTVRKMAAFLEKDISDEQIDMILQHVAFDNMKNNEKMNKIDIGVMDHSISPFMRKGKVGDWKNHFTPEQNEYVQQIYAKRIQGSGLSFDDEIDENN